MNRKISTVICTYNRDRFIRKSLECLVQQSLPKSDYEVIVVDNNSTDDTAAICKKFIEENRDTDIRYVFESNKGLSFARNRGITEAKYDIITYLDDDAEAVPGYLQELSGFLARHPEVAGVGGKVVPIYPDAAEPAWMNRYLNGFVGKVDWGTTPRKYDAAMKYPAGCNMTYRKEILQRAGGFNNQLTFRSDDKYIFFAVKAISDHIYYLPGAMVHHNIDQHRLTFSNFKKLYLKTGNEEKVRLRSEGNRFGVFMKLVELTIKLGASLVLYLKFVFRQQEIKGRYLVYAQWFTLVGFLKKQVYVR